MRMMKPFEGGESEKRQLIAILDDEPRQGELRSALRNQKISRFGDLRSSEKSTLRNPLQVTRN